MDKKTTSIYDIAKEAGVSIATVSRTINTPEKVNEATRNKIMSIMVKHNYTPNALAQSLVSRSTRTVGVIISNIKNPFYGDLLHSIELEAAELGYSILLGNTVRSFVREKQYVETFLKKKVDGIIFSGGRPSDDEYTEHICRTAESLPVIMTNHLVVAKNVYCILTDETIGAYEAVKHLVDEGHSKIAYVNGFSNTYPNIVKKESYIKCLSQHGIDILDELIVDAKNDDLEGGYQACGELLGRNTKFSALFAANDLMAIGAMRKLSSVGYRIPHDVAVVGYDNIDFCEYLTPRLSSVTQNMVQMGQSAIRLLDHILKKESVPKITYLDPKLMIRESSKSV